jgi:hypothetical protein
MRIAKAAVAAMASVVLSRFLVSGGSSPNRQIVDLIASVGRLGNVIENGLKR